MKQYHNYHKHDYYGNPWSMDVVVSPKEYGQRAAELGHTTLFTTNHGVQGNVFECMEVAKEFNLKMVYGVETYYVPDRTVKDRSNKHLIIIARNNDGAMQLNDILSEAHMSGFYYKPRVDRELISQLDPKNFILTTACVGGIWEDTELILALNRQFKGSFFLELQDHDIPIQKTANQRLLTLSKETGIPIIHANDSHYILPTDARYRDIFLKAKFNNMHNANNDLSDQIEAEEAKKAGRKPGPKSASDDVQTLEQERGMVLDYPDADEIYRRYEKQGILTRAQVDEALDNTLVFDECEPITIINDDIKLPHVSEHPMDDLRKIIYDQWDIDKQEIPKSRWKEYEAAIEEELDVVDKTNMADYFLIDYQVVKNGQEKYNGLLTNTGRGSAPSFYITKLLGLTNIDRIAAPVTLFPSRFMSTERILGSKSLPDIDLNTTDKDPFIKATEDLLGAENCAWMIAWKPLQEASAFRMYCKGIGLDIRDYDSVAKNLEQYKADKQWKDIIQESKRFIGVVESISESPCSMALYYKPLRKELGLIRINSSGKICCLLDGYNCDKYKYLKNDYLTVTVWAIIREVCKLANIKIPTINELNNLLDDKTYEVYSNGLTCTINQADSDMATGDCMVYKPHSVADMSAFVAIIRPGCASLKPGFLKREPYTTGVQELDNLLVEGAHRMIYQELIMKYLIWLGVKETGSYDIIKKIAKKKFKEAELAKLKEQLLAGWIKKVGKDDGFIETWTVVEQAAHYSFNASHSLSYAYDSLYGAYLKSHYPLEYYTVALNFYAGDMDRTSRLSHEMGYYDLTLQPIQFRHSRSQYSFDRETNSIYKGIESVKNLNAQVAEELYALKDNEYKSFIDLLYDIKDKTTLRTNQLTILIKLNFFSEFGEINKLLKIADLFLKFYNKTQISKDKMSDPRIAEIFREYSKKETAKLFKEIYMRPALTRLSELIASRPRSIRDIVLDQQEYLGYIDVKDKKYAGMGVVQDVNTKYSPRLKIYSLKNGKTVDCKIDKRTFNATKLVPTDIISIQGQKYKPKVQRNADGEFVQIPGTKELWLTKYEKVEYL